MVDKIAGMEIIPRNYHIVETNKGSFLQKIKKRRNKHKKTKAQKARLRSYNKQFFIPLKMGISLAPELVRGVAWLSEYGLNSGVDLATKARKLYNAVISPLLLGVELDSDFQPRFNFEGCIAGLLTYGTFIGLTVLGKRFRTVSALPSKVSGGLVRWV